MQFDKSKQEIDDDGHVVELARPGTGSISNLVPELGE